MILTENKIINIIEEETLNVLLEAYLLEQARWKIAGDNQYEYSLTADGTSYVAYKNGKAIGTFKDDAGLEKVKDAAPASVKNAVEKSTDSGGSWIDSFKKSLGFGPEEEDEQEQAPEEEKTKVSLKTRILGRAAQILAVGFDAVTPGVENFVTQCFVDFISRRTRPITARDLSKDLRDCLRIIANDASRRKKTMWGSDRDYSRVANSEEYVSRFGAPSSGNYNMEKNMAGKASIVDSLVSRDPLNNIFNSFTHLRVTFGEDTIGFTDIYDFNPIVNILGGDPGNLKARKDEEFFKDESNFYEFLKNAMKGQLKVKRAKGWVPVSILSRAGIENLCRFYMGLFGYSGIPVAVVLKKG